MFTIKYHYLVVKNDIPKLDNKSKQRLKSAIEQKLTSKPEIFGKPLRNSLKNYRKLRVGDYRIILKVEALTVYILLIEHRSIVYEEIYKRIIKE